MHQFQPTGLPMLSPQRMSSPTCDDLGIPPNSVEPFTFEVIQLGQQENHTNHNNNMLPCTLLAETNDSQPIQPPNVSRTLAPLTAVANTAMVLHQKTNDPFSPHCLIPLPNHLMDFNCGFEPAFIRKRNERERERVRCVNDGYARLKKHLPLPHKDKRISKVETLRTAIHYIRYLEDMLQMSNDRRSKISA